MSPLSFSLLKIHFKIAFRKGPSMPYKMIKKGMNDYLGEAPNLHNKTPYLAIIYQNRFHREMNI